MSAPSVHWKAERCEMFANSTAAIFRRWSFETWAELETFVKASERSPHLGPWRVWGETEVAYLP